MPRQRAVSPTIYVGRPDLIDLQDELDFAGIEETLADVAKASTEITILGAFYSVEALVSLGANVPKRRRKICRIRIAAGLEATSTIPKAWEDMRRLRHLRVELGFHNH